jgi:hypothetical protein
MAERSTLSCRMRSESRHISYTGVAREIASPRDAPRPALWNRAGCRLDPGCGPAPEAARRTVAQRAKLGDPSSQG